MGDVHPPETKIALIARLIEIAPPELQRVFLSSSGGEAIEFALKTAYLATQRSGVVAFAGAYHGLSLGALEVGGIERFRAPFAPLISDRTTYLPFPARTSSCDEALARLRQTLAGGAIGAVVIEPIQGRGGVVIPPEGYLPGVRAVCDEFGAVLIFDEIYTGFARTGTFFACEREAVVPDLLCVGKAIANGVPLSAVIGSERVMNAWPRSEGEALHTSTYLGNPLACAAALAVIDEIETHGLCAAARRIEALLAAALMPLVSDGLVVDARGRGALWAIEFDLASRANAVVRAGLQNGLILLQSGESGTSITIAPPLVIDEMILIEALLTLRSTIEEVGV